MRKGPEESATKFKIGTKKIGNDGNYWIIKKNKNGVQRWVKDNKSKRITKRKSIKIDGKKLTIKGKKYLTHDNGGRPFLVVINNNDVSIFKLPNGVYEDKNTSKSDYTELVKEYKKVKKVFIGKSPKIDMTKFSAGYGKYFDGNTILIEIRPKQYCLVAERIVEFSTKDSIEKYVSPVGNNDVPYPIAYGSENVYFFGYDEHKYIPKEIINGLTIDEIQEKYIGKCCPWKSELDKYKKKLKEKLIHKRPGW
tara:strand:+ start:10558 stop:11310 length:753 start_codon:yes stop_codon:yes gene_type:complete